MVNALTQISVSLKIGLLLAIIVCSALIAQSSMIVNYPCIGTAVSIDMLITLPVAYLLFIRNTRIPKTTVLAVFGISLMMTSYLLPENDRSFLNVILVFGLPLIEVFAFCYIGYRIFRTRRAYAGELLKGRDLMERSRTAFAKELKPEILGRAVAFEFGVIAYAFFKWRDEKCENAFTYHKKNGSTILMGMLLFLLAAETTVFHILIAQWNLTLAWMLTAVSIYFALQLFAHLKALRLRPISIVGSELLFRCGILGDTSIDVALIGSVKMTGRPVEDEDGHLTIVPLGPLCQPNVMLRVRRGETFSGFYGFEKRFSSISFYVDEPNEFVEILNGRMIGGDCDG